MDTETIVAGRELDARIAVDLMDWDRRSESWYDEEGVEGTRFIAPDGTELTAFGWGDECNYDELDDALPHYSTDIAAAWQVVEQLHADGWWVTLTASPYETVTVDLLKTVGSPIVERTIKRHAEADTAPLAICRAALSTVGAV